MRYRGSSKKKVEWDSRSVRALRQHLGASQQALSEELGVRQQTISEWESGKYKPRGACARVLTMVAERSGFAYQITSEQGPVDWEPKSPSDQQ